MRRGWWLIQCLCTNPLFMPIGTQNSAHERATFINELVICIRGTKKKAEVVAAQCEINTDVMVLFGPLLP